MSLGQSLQKYTYRYLLDKALSQVPADIDKREGSIIFDALAPACYLLAEYFMEVHRLAQEISIETASGEWLDNKVVEVGISRNQATAAVKKAVFRSVENGVETPMSVPIGSRFATAGTGAPLYYVVTGAYRLENGAVEVGSYELTCETAGSAGDRYTGPLTPLDFIQNLATATLTESVLPGGDTETDEELRTRYLNKVRYRAFGGNIAQYKELVLSLFGTRVGGVQVYPTWNGGGTVKLSVVSGDHRAIRDADGSVGDFVTTMQDAIDPDVIQGQVGFSGMGLGSAPIDHQVTVVTPEEYVVNISADIYLAGATIDQVRPRIESAINDYFATLRTDWDSANDMNEYQTVIYQSQIVRAALTVSEVSDFSNVVLSNTTGQKFTNITLLENGQVQQLPVLGEVILNVKS